MHSACLHAMLSGSIGGTNSFVLEIIPENLIKQRTYQILKAIPRPTGFFQSKASVWVSRSTVLYCRVRWLCPIIPDGPSVITREYLRESDNQPTPAYQIPSAGAHPPCVRHGQVMAHRVQDPCQNTELTKYFHIRDLVLLAGFNFY